MPLPKKLLERGVRDVVRICDGRMSGTAYGTVVLHVTTEAAAGGPLLRIGARGAEKPAALLDDDTYVDLSDVVPDVDEAFFGSGGLERIAPVVTERAASGATATIGDSVSAWASSRRSGCSRAT